MKECSNFDMQPVSDISHESCVGNTWPAGMALIPGSRRDSSVSLSLHQHRTPVCRKLDVFAAAPGRCSCTRPERFGAGDMEQGAGAPSGGRKGKGLGRGWRWA